MPMNESSYDAAHLAIYMYLLPVDGLLTQRTLYARGCLTLDADEVSSPMQCGIIRHSERNVCSPDYLAGRMLDLTDVRCRACELLATFLVSGLTNELHLGPCFLWYQPQFRALLVLSCCLWGLPSRRSFMKIRCFQFSLDRGFFTIGEGFVNTPPTLQYINFNTTEQTSKQEPLKTHFFIFQLLYTYSIYFIFEF